MPGQEFPAIPSMSDTVLGALRAGDFAAAEAAARQLIADQPADAQAHHLLGLALQQRGDLAGAGAAFERASQLAPERADFHVSRAMIATQLRRHDSARDALNLAVKQDPNQLMAYISLAHMALAASDLAQAEQHLRYAERINPEHPHVLTVRGQMLLARGDRQGALAALSRAGEAAPADAMVQGALGLALLGQRHFAFAEQALRNALQASDGARGLRYALVQALLAQGRNDEAAVEIETLLAQKADDPQAMTLKGQLATLRGAHEEAVIALTASLRQEPRQPGALEAAVASWRALHAEAQGEAFLESLLQQAPNFEPAWVALIELQRGQPRRAADTALRWHQACPRSAAANEIAAQVAEAGGDYPRAIELAEAAVALDRNAIPAQVILARSELRADNPAAARARLEPIHAAVRDRNVRRGLGGWLGRACDAAGDYELAARYWIQAHAESAAQPFPPLVLPDAGLEARLADALAASGGAAADAPVLLWGPPGSRPERLSALLQGAGLVVLDDRFGPNPRDDGFRLDGLGTRSAASPEEAGARFAQRWRDARATLGAQPNDVDWLPYWDARLAPPLVRGLPGTRLIVALADPRDLLVNWLAFGAPQRLSMADPLVSARWLALQLEQLAFLAQRTQPALQVVWMDRLDNAPNEVAAELAAFLGLPQAPSLEMLPTAAVGAGGLPTAFPAGHWKHYADPLREAFTLLEPLATRFAGAGA
jgi:tetratricopeptide (TPR) repeat protein